MQFHPLAEVFPLIDGAEFEELVASIKAHGLREPIVVFEGAILDGRNRYRACEKAGVEPRFEEFTGDDPLSFVEDINDKRRHYTSEQKRARAAAKLKAEPEESDRAIAQVLGVDHKTVAAVRDDLVRRGEIPHVETITDTKGRKQPAGRGKKAKSRKPTNSTSIIPVESQHDRDLRLLMGAWESTCASAHDAFLAQIHNEDNS